MKQKTLFYGKTDRPDPEREIFDKYYIQYMRRIKNVNISLVFH